MKAPQSTEHREDRRWERLNAMPRQALAWLALGPAWPSEIVESGFPIEPEKLLTGPEVTEKLQSQADQGFLTALPATTPWEGTLFLLPAGTRRSAQDLFALDPSYGKSYLQKELMSSGVAMQQAGGELLRYDPMLSRWSTLAVHAQNELGVAVEFDRQVGAAFEAADKAHQLSVPEASRWIDAAQPIADLLGGPLLVSVGRARRRLELYSRRANDKRKLANYLPRPDQDRAIDELLRDDEHWALHFAGEGGVGKTMLLRHLTERAELAVSRVDFDYLNPDYPRRAPGLLLVALAEEFRLQAGPDMESAFERFDRLVQSLHSQIQGSVRTGQEETMSLDSGLFKDVLQAFVDALDTMADNRQPVLLLDTCEELAKIRPDGSIPDNVSVTFEILKELHERSKRMRVVFAGRRPLASVGFGWTAETQLAPQPHLRLHLIEHFTLKEATDYLSKFHEEVEGKTLTVPTDHIPVLLNLSRVAPGGPRQRFSIPGQPLSEEQRYNAYDLDVYANWVCRDPTLTPEKLAAEGRHYYVRERIVGRAGKVRPIVPILAVCGRFDVEILKTFLNESLGAETGADITPEQRIRAVTDLDWIQPDRAAGPNMWRVDNPLRDRLLGYYESQESSVYEAARRTVAEVLRQETLSRPFAQLNEQYFEVTLDGLSNDPQTAAAWWAGIEDRIASEGQWLWASRLISVLLAHPVLATDQRVSLRAAVLATRAAALLHTGEADPLTIWKDVEVALAQYPDVPQRKRIAVRAGLAVGRLASLVAGLGAGDDPQLVAASLARVEAAIENGDHPWGAEVWRSLDQLLASVKDQGMHVFAQSLRARSGIGADKRDPTRPIFRNAVYEDAARTVWKSSLNEAAAGIANCWLDWLPPDDLACRIALEFVRSGLAKPGDIPLKPTSKTVDADRLASAMLLQFGIASESRAGDLEVASQAPRCKAHRYYPPYFVAALAVRARDDSPSDALAELGKLSSAFASVGDVALAIDRAALDIRLRYRLASASVPPAVKNSTAASDRLLAAIYEGLFLDSSIRPEGAVASIVEDRCYPAPELAMREAEVKLITEGPGAASAVKPAELFDAAGDKRGQLLALVAESAWAAATKDKQRLTNAMEKLGFCYELVLAGQKPPGLPLWAELEEAVVKRRASGVLDRVPKDWQPTAVRITGAMHNQFNNDKPDPELLSWVTLNYSVGAWGKQLIPTELEFLLTPPPTARVTLIRKWIDIAKSVFYGAIGVAVLYGFAVLAYRAVVFALHKTGVKLGTVPNIVTTAIAVVVLFKGISVVVVRLPSWLESMASLYFRLFELWVEVVPVEVPADRNRPLEVGCTAHRRLKFLRFQVTDVKVQIQATSEERYAWLRETAITADSPSAFSRLKRLLMGSPLDVEIAVDDSTAAAPWEAILELPVHDASLSDSPYRTRRTLHLREKRAEQVAAAGRLEVAVWSWAPEARVAHRSILQMLGSGGNKVNVTIPPSPDVTAPDTDILLIYADPIEGTAALGLELENVRRVAKTKTSSSYGSEVLGGTTTPGIYTSNSITSRCPNLRMCIVVAPPSSVSPRTSSDRRDAAVMRRIGAELFRTGIPAVLILPSAVEQAPPNIFSRLQPILRGDRRPDNAARALVATVNDLQQALARMDLPDREGALEIALDVCLYIEEKLELRVNPDKVRPVPLSEKGA